MVFEKIQELLAEQLNIEKEKITKETDIINDLKADSISLMEFTLALEDEFGISVPDEDAKDLTTIGKLAEYVESKTQK